MSDSRLLPTGSSPLEVAAAKACAEIEKTPVSIRDLWNPDNRRADDSGKWMFKDGAVIKRIYTADEQHQLAESQKATLLSEAESVILLLERAVRLNMATEEERSRLEAWERYSVLVSRVDPANPEWPEMPQ
ncbi:TPA: phage tail protein I [Escherichia coli]|nr:phage tail protein I [Escherichia coli]